MTRAAPPPRPAPWAPAMPAMALRTTTNSRPLAHRSAQAHTQRGEYAQARGFLKRAEAAAQGASELAEVRRVAADLARAKEAAEQLA